MAKNVFKTKKGIRLRASALQLTLVIALIVTLFLTALIYLYAFYQRQDKNMVNREKVYQIMESALKIGLSNNFPLVDTTWSGMLYSDDTIVIQKRQWGLYEQVNITVKWQSDSLRRGFFVGLKSLDSTALYISDEDRNVAVSGATNIRGTAFLPKAGIKPMFVDGKLYTGDKKIILGDHKFSARKLPEIQKSLLENVYPLTSMPLVESSYGHHSFYNQTTYWYDILPITLERDSVMGNIVVQSDSLINIGSSMVLNDMVCLAPVVRIASGFRGSVQIFAKDSIIIGDNVILDYPSSLVLDADNNQGKNGVIRIGKDFELCGTILLYEPERSRMPHMLTIDEGAGIHGEVIVHGMFKYTKPLTIRGAAYCYRFITQTPRSLYENYLIDIDIDRFKMDEFMLQSHIWNRVQNQQRKILSWVD